MAPKARMRQANKLNEQKVNKRGKIPTTLVSLFYHLYVRIRFKMYIRYLYWCRITIQLSTLAVLSCQPVLGSATFIKVNTILAFIIQRMRHSL